MYNSADVNTEIGGFFDNPEILESYHQAQRLTWWGKPFFGQPPYVSWKTDHYISGVAGDIVSCPEEEVLQYHHLEALAQSYRTKSERRGFVDFKVYSRTVLQYFLKLSGIMDKQIELRSPSLLEKRYSFDLRVDPKMTWLSRIKQMKLMAEGADKILAEDQNVSQVLFGGSLQRGTRYPNDVDLLVVTKELLTFSLKDLLSSGSPLCALPFANCQGRNGNPFEHLQPGTLYQLDRIAENTGSRLDCILIPYKIFHNPTCCPTHTKLVKDFLKKG